MAGELRAKIRNARKTALGKRWIPHTKERDFAVSVVVFMGVN